MGKPGRDWHGESSQPAVISMPVPGVPYVEIETSRESKLINFSFKMDLHSSTKGHLPTGPWSRRLVGGGGGMLGNAILSPRGKPISFSDVGHYNTGAGRAV